MDRTGSDGFFGWKRIAASAAVLLLVVSLCGWSSSSPPVAQRLAVSAASAKSQDLPAGAASRRTVMVPMRDGTRLATEVLLPEGEGPWPTVLMRTPYGRTGGALQHLKRYLEHDCAVVTQDFRGLFASEGKFDLFSFFMGNIRDGYDTVEWVAEQDWSNGRVGITGGSGPGIAGKLALMSDPPHLVAASTNVAASNLHRYAGFSGGVRRAHMVDNWLKGRGVKVEKWPKPRLTPFNREQRRLDFRGRDIDIPLTDRAGWFDIFSQSALDDFAALKDNGKTFTVVGPTGHGNIRGLHWPGEDTVNQVMSHTPGLKPLKTDVDMGRSTLYYYLMGDAREGGPPGNVWKKTHEWPVPHTDTPVYMTADGKLQLQRPDEADASLSFRYDPNNPVPTRGGANLILPKGPMDQRPLSERDDILRFSTEPLDEPVEVTGKVRVKLHVSSDVPDTTFMAKLIDVYPDGYEALILDSAVMTRYRDGLDNAAPMKPGEIYELTIDLWSTALVFDKGHKIAIHVTSSNAPRYEVHPNTYEPVSSYDEAEVAHNTVHLSSKHPSRIILPVVEPGAVEDFEP